MQRFHLPRKSTFAVNEEMDASHTKTKVDQLCGELTVPLLPGSMDSGFHHTNCKFQESSSSQSNEMSDAEALQRGDSEKSIISSTITKDTCDDPVCGECIVLNDFKGHILHPSWLLYPPKNMPRKLTSW